MFHALRFFNVVSAAATGFAWDLDFFLAFLRACRFCS
jgi:hypothetical protein